MVRNLWRPFSLHYNCCSGEKATAESIAEAIADNRAELVHLPSAIDLPSPLPSKECPTCDGSVSYTQGFFKLSCLNALTIFVLLFSHTQMILFPNMAGTRL